MFFCVFSSEGLQRGAGDGEDGPKVGNSNNNVYLCARYSYKKIYD